MIGFLHQHFRPANRGVVDQTAIPGTAPLPALASFSIATTIRLSRSTSPALGLIIEEIARTKPESIIRTTIEPALALSRLRPLRQEVETFGFRTAARLW